MMIEMDASTQPVVRIAAVVAVTVAARGEIAPHIFGIFCILLDFE